MEGSLLSDFGLLMESYRLCWIWSAFYLLEASDSDRMISNILLLKEEEERLQCHMTPCEDYWIAMILLIDSIF